MKVLVTGSSSGIGREAALIFLERGFEVYGMDVLPTSIQETGYTHYISDISDASSLPSIPDVDILVASAGVQDSGHDIETNLKGTMNTVEKYGVRKGIRSILIVASASAHTGAEFPEYSASKGGLLAYMRNVASRIAPYGGICNSISPGGVETELNRPVMEDKVLWNKIMDLTPLRKWATAREIAEWIYFLTVVNKSASGEDFLID
ncbi:MAG: SDR family NAD(P)-dependent oxidoreductase, partial [Candidatus Ornithospirochaeta sp.]